MNMRRLVAGVVALVALESALGAAADTPASTNGVLETARLMLEARLQGRFTRFAVEPVATAVAAPCKGAQFRGADASSALSSRMLVTVQATCPDGLEQTIPVWFKVKSYAPTLVAAHDVRAGAILGKEDVRQEDADVAATPGLVPVNADLTGMHTAVPLHAGSPIRQASLSRDAEVTAQQPVVIRSGHSAVKIEVLGLALQNGHVGQHVQVINLSSGETLTARVASDRMVEIP